MTDKSEIIAKIKKCLALSKSSNEHEAAAALRQAQKLMEQHGVTDLDVELADVEEDTARSGASKQPARWELQLAAWLSDAFGTEVYFRRDLDLRNFKPVGTWHFVGISPGPEITRYAFEVLLRQVKRARADHIKGPLKRCGPINRTRRADLFCEGWVASATDKIDKFAGREGQAEKIAAYLGRMEFKTLKHTNRQAGKKLAERDWGDIEAGQRAGKNAELNRGVGGATPLALE